jgi:hypothetical protein
MTSHSTSATFYITIIDNNGQRLDKLQDKIISIVQQMNPVTISQKVAFFHIQDAEYINESNFSDHICKIIYPRNIVSNCNSKKDLIKQDIVDNNFTIFWYSAGSLIRKEEELKQIGFQDPLIIDYVMSTENVEKLTTEDIQAFIIYAISGRKDKNIQGKIKLLNRAKVLAAISILCQGYLAINYDSKSSVVHESLEKMGWNTSLIITDIAKKKLKVQKAEWWLQIFGDQSENLETLLQEEYNGNINAAISNLIAAIRQEKIEPDLVANAYIAIANKLNEE